MWENMEMCSHLVTEDQDRSFFINAHSEYSLAFSSWNTPWLSVPITLAPVSSCQSAAQVYTNTINGSSRLA